MFQTVVINKTGIDRRLQWHHGHTLAANGVRVLDGCYPSCLTGPVQKALLAELKSGSTVLFYVTDDIVVTPDKMDAMIAQMSGQARQNPVVDTAPGAVVTPRAKDPLQALPPEVQAVMDNAVAKLMARAAAYKAEKLKLGDKSEGVFGTQPIEAPPSEPTQAVENNDAFVQGAMEDQLPARHALQPGDTEGFKEATSIKTDILGGENTEATKVVEEQTKTRVPRKLRSKVKPAHEEGKVF